MQHLAAAVVADDHGRTQAGQILVLGRRGLFQAPQLCLVKVLRGGAVGGGDGVVGHGVGHLFAQEGLLRVLDDGHAGLVPPGALGNNAVHLLVLLHHLLGRVILRQGVVFIVVAQISRHAAAAQREQHRQCYDLLLIEFQGFLGVTHAVGQAEAVGDGQHHAQKQRQQYGLNGEHENVLDHAGDDHGEGVLFAVHVKGIIPHHDGGLEQHIDDQADGKPAEHDPGGE